jgi:hypothetical protein
MQTIQRRVQNFRQVLPAFSTHPQIIKLLLVIVLKVRTIENLRQ